MDWKNVVLVIVIAVIVSYAFMNRFGLMDTGNYAAYRLDRWTGDVVYMSLSNGEAVKIK